jgi:hypothetical protein
MLQVLPYLSRDIRLEHALDTKHFSSTVMDPDM